MNSEKLKQLMNGESVEIGDKGNRIILTDEYFLVEFFEYVSESEGNMYSCGPDFVNIEEAIAIATKYTSESYTKKMWS